MTALGASPVRLLGENPNGLVSLLDMFRFYAAALTTITWELNSLLAYKDAPSRETKIPEMLQELRSETEKLNWVDLSAQIDRVLRRLSSGGIEADGAEAHALITDLVGNVQHHLTRDLFLCVQAPKIEHLSRPREVFGQHVLDAFPSASYDLLEGSRCFALDRWTASVFHLMRALEVLLSVIGSTFGVSLANTNWAPAISEIESKIRVMHTQPPWKGTPGCKEQQEFYAQAASHLGVLKDAWRNYTAHARGKYDEREAADVMVGVRSFAQKLSERLHE